VDSIAANLSEGLGRYHYKEKKNFSYYSRGSLFEAQIGLTKAHNRKLMAEATFTKMKDDLETIGKMINSYIKSIGDTQPPMPNP
jgi:four helix bundle protein